MPIPGLNHDRCLQRNFVDGKRGKVNSVPVKFLRGGTTGATGTATENLFTDSAGNRGGVGKMPKSDAEALAMINEVAPQAQKGTPLTLDDVYIHYMEAANDNFIPDRFMFLDESTLRNIATDAQRGFAFMNSHRTGGLSHPAELPFGRSFAGRFEKVTEGEGDEAKTRTRTIIGIYMLKGEYPNGNSGPSTDALSRGIDAGTIFDVSVGLWGGQSLCDICGEDIDDWCECGHIPGTHYDMDETDRSMQEERDVPNGVASYTLFDAGCGETSSVYDGAVPGAGFAKAMAFAKGDKYGTTDEALEVATLSEIAAAYPKLLQGGAMAHSDIAESILSYLSEGELPNFTHKGNLSMSDVSGQSTAPKPSTRRLFGLLPGQAPQQDTQEAVVQLSVADYNALTNRADTAESALAAAQNHPVLSVALAAGIDTADKFNDLKAQAKYGDDYAKEVGASLTKQAVRRFGQDKAPGIVKTYSKLPLEDQKDAAATWKQEADEKMGIQGEDKDGNERGATRITAPPASNNAENLNGGGSGKAWDKLTDEQKAVGVQMGMNTDDKREAFAKNTLSAGGN